MTNIKSNKSVIDGFKDLQSGLQNAFELTQRAAKIGFDWPNIEMVFEKMQEELLELKIAISKGDKVEITDELGDILFVCANLARHLEINPDVAIRAANEKFIRRFKSVERIAQKEKPTLQTYGLDYLENTWQQVKKEE